MRLSSKHDRVKRLLLSDFTGGINVAIPPEDLSNNELVWATNFEYDGNSGALKVRDGLVKVIDFSDPITEMWYDVRTDRFFVVTKGSSQLQKLYVYDWSSVTYLGDLNGSEIPVFASWGDNEVLISSGGKLQVYDPLNGLREINSSPESFIVFTLYGRVGVVKYNSDEVWFSGVGDYNAWDPVDPSNPAIFVQFGYKDGGKINAISMLNKDLIVFKDSRHCYRLVGWYPNWSVYELSRDVGCLNHKSVCQVANDIFFLDVYGFKSLRTVVAYGDIKVANVDAKVNKFLRAMLGPGARLLYNPVKSQILVQTEENNSFVYVYNPVLKNFTAFDFYNLNPVALTYKESDVYLAAGSGLYKFTPYEASDDGNPFVSTLKTKRFVTTNSFLLKKYGVEITPFGGVNSSIKIGTFSTSMNIITSSIFAFNALGYAYDALYPAFSYSVATSSKRMNYRHNYIDVELSFEGSFYLNGIYLEIVEV